MIRMRCLFVSISTFIPAVGCGLLLVLSASFGTNGLCAEAQAQSFHTFTKAEVRRDRQPQEPRKLEGSGGTCEGGMKSLYDSIGDDYLAMFRSFMSHCDEDGGNGDEVCSAVGFGELPSMDANFELNYSPLVGTDEYQSFVDACSDLGDGYEACSVDTVYRNVGGGTVSVTAQPICIPPRCGVVFGEGGDGATALGAAGNGNTICDALGGGDGEAGCSLVSMGPTSSVTCLDETAVGRAAITSEVDGGECEDDVRGMASFQGLVDAKDRLNDVVKSACLGNGPGGGTCSLEMVPIDMSIRANFNEMRGDEHYVAYGEGCEEHGADMCHLSYRFNFRLSVFDLGEVTFSGDIDGLPVCIAAGCSEEALREFGRKFAFDELRSSGGFVLDRRLASVTGREDDARRVLAAFESDLMNLEELCNGVGGTNEADEFFRCSFDFDGSTCEGGSLLQQETTTKSNTASSLNAYSRASNINKAEFAVSVIVAVMALCLVHL